MLSDIHQRCNFAGVKPENYEEARKNDVWKKVVEEKIRMIEKTNTRKLVAIPKEREVVSLKLIYKIKLNQEGNIHKHKARQVARSFTQKSGIDFYETFSPVARLETIRTVIDVAAQMKWMIFQLDLKPAFLNGKLDEEIYFEKPQEFFVQGGVEKVYRLKKDLYGMKQDPTAW